MDSTLTSGSQYLFAHCITDGALDEMSEEQRTSIILTITKIKEIFFKEETTPKMRPYNSLFELTPRTNRFK